MAKYANDVLVPQREYITPIDISRVDAWSLYEIVNTLGRLLLASIFDGPIQPCSNISQKLPC